MTAAGAAERVPVLMYHRVDPRVDARESGYGVTPKQFAAHLAWLAAHGYQPCKVQAFDAWFHGGAALPRNSVLITFDDGFSSLYEYAMPLLGARGWPATVFLVSGRIGQRDAWASQEFGTAGSNTLLDAGQITEMARHGIEFHSHSRTHPDLTALDDAALAEQVSGSRQELQDLLGRPVDYFAYPFGRHDARVRRAVEVAGYRLAFSVDPGFNRAGAAALQVRRLDITGRDGRSRFGRKVQKGSNDGSLTSELRYLGGRLRDRLFSPKQASG